jgi:hypothetical protein
MERSSPCPVDERDVLDAERLFMGAAVHAGPFLPGSGDVGSSEGDTQDGVKDCRIASELPIEADEVGASLTWATAKVERAS